MGGKLSLSFGDSSCSDLAHITSPLDSDSILDESSTSTFRRQISLPNDPHKNRLHELSLPKRATELSASFEDRSSTSLIPDSTSITPYCYSNPDFSMSSLWPNEENIRISARPSILPPPPLPPRGLKKVDQQCTSSSPSDSHKSDPRIYPICQNGVKMSDTHYWLIPPPRRHGSVRLHRNPNDMYVNVEDSNDDSVTKTSQFRRGNSERYSTSRWKMQHDMIMRLLQVVPMATEQEANIVLIGANWNFEDASHRMKEELLCRTGYVSMHRSQRLLTKNNWDLEAATRQAVEEHNLRQAFKS